jgi:colanic acid biosynthesis glycosyl transferase WcaI
MTRLLYRIEAAAYRQAARVSGISHGMLGAFEAKGVPSAKIVPFPNGVVLPEPNSMPAPGAFRKRHGFVNGEFLAVYSGNLGVKQGLDLLVEAAQFLRDGSIRIIVAGDGAERDRLAEMVRQKNLGNILLLPLQETRAFHEMLVDANLCLVVQRAGTGRWFFPSKLLNIFAFGKPVLTVSDADSELARMVVGENLGANVTPGDPESLARTMENLALDHEWLAALGKAGRAYVRRFEMGKVLADFESALAGMEKTRGKTHPPP